MPVTVEPPDGTKDFAKAAPGQGENRGHGRG